LATAHKYKRFLDKLNNLLHRLEISEDTILVATAVLVGLGTGIGAVLFRFLINAVEWVGYDWIPRITSDFGKAYIIFVPAIGGLIVGLLIYFFAREAKGHGVPEVMEAVALRGGRIRPLVAVVKSLASALTIGSGGSAGREGPIVQIGSSLGSSIGQALHLSDDRIRNLVACGAAGGIAATFNAPIAGVIFALEVIIGVFSVRYFSTVVISSVVASVIGRVVFGDVPAFPLPVEYGVNSLWEYAFYPILGVLAAFLGVIYVRLLYRSEDIFEAWTGVPEWVKPAVGGALLGVVALTYPLVTGIQWDITPQIFNVGYDVIGSALDNGLMLGVVLALLVLKLIATSLTLGSGGSGGVFAPGLFMGAMLGTAFELVINMLFPDIAAPAGAYALVGMAAVFAASAHAPITAVIILSELTDDHRIVLPLMLTVIVATIVSRRLLNNQSIYTLKLMRRGVNIQSGRDADIMQSVIVDEVITHDVRVVTTSMTIGELLDTFNYTHSHGFSVLNEHGKLWGIVTVSDLDRAHAQSLPHDTNVTVISTPRDRLIVAYPDEAIGNVLIRLGQRGLGRLPVVSRDDSNHLVGMIRRADIISAYKLAVARRAEIQHKTTHIMTQSPDGTEFIEVTLSADSYAVGKNVKKIASSFPDECILVSIQRAGVVFIPHGNTTFEQGDHITAFVLSDHLEMLIHNLMSGEDQLKT
jgi:chloride channel protein, CIC family